MQRINGRLNEGMSMSKERDLIAWKTDAWADPAMVAWYHQRMEVHQGNQLLKNRVEVDLMVKHAIGKRILDVGAGTGRASIPLAQAGCDVVAIDSSQAMLDQYRVNAGDTPVELKLGDVTRLPSADGEFDTVVSLNVMVHFPHWKEILKEWKRVVRPGGRIVFDIHSLDHHDAIAKARPNQVIEGRQAEKFEDYVTRVNSDEMLSAADELGLSVIEMVPYAGVFGCGNPNHWLTGSLASKSGWDRLLSWLAMDSRQFTFGLFLEQECFAYLSPLTTSRMMVVLENREGKVGNATWQGRRRSLDEALAQPISLSSLSGLIPQWDASWRKKLNAHLDWPRNRVMAYFLWSAFWNYPGLFNLAGFLEERHLTVLERWHEEWQMDALTTHLLRAMADEPNFKALFTYRDVSLGNAFEYDLTREVLTHYFEAFKA